MAAGVLVFDDAPLVVTDGAGESGRTFVIDEVLPDDLLVIDDPTSYDVLAGATDTDVLVFDTEVTVTDVLQAQDHFLLVDPAPVPANLVLQDSLEELLVVTPGGPPGPPGTAGEPGPQGIPGADGPGAYYETYSFATPSTVWTIVHNRNTLALNVETVDLAGNPMEGYVRPVDLNAIEVDWYYPTAGEARLFR